MVLLDLQMPGMDGFQVMEGLKEIELDEVLARVHNMLEARLLHKRLHNYNDVLEQRVREQDRRSSGRLPEWQEG